MSDELPQVWIDETKLRKRSRRDFILFGAGALAGAGGMWWIAPVSSKKRVLGEHATDFLDTAAARAGLSSERSERFQNRALTFDDDVAEALYSPTRTVRTYSRSQATPLRNNYNGATPGAGYLPVWSLELSGLASGKAERFAIGDLHSRFPRRDQVTRLCCVEGWSA